ncbi:hypothetical protein LJC24_05620 [Desulfococcaceae bacterium OttesenSCG-928-F15]|nr:hypothetical protein [Desulfococcaceae bacterium OttesenSCG-928-F15]
MEVFFYKIPFCPRCIMAERYLKRTMKERKNLTMQVRPLPTYLKEAREFGIAMAPALRVGEHAISGIWLTEKDIQEFLDSVE